MTDDCATLRRDAEALRREAKALDRQARLLAAKDEVAAILARKPVEATRRLSVSSARRERILAAHGHCCAVDGCLETTALELDHVIPLELGGEDTDENLQPLCVFHHRQKTKADVKAIAKARRLRTAGDKKPKRAWPSRSFARAR